MERAWLATEHRAAKKRRVRSDASGPGSRGPRKKRDVFSSHLTTSDTDQLTNAFVSVGAEWCESCSDTDGAAEDSVLAGRELLDE